MVRTWVWLITVNKDDLEFLLYKYILLNDLDLKFLLYKYILLNDL